MHASIPEFNSREFLRSLTPSPGVYRMLDAQGAVLYVGKARNLRRRVTSYFRSVATQTPKTRALMRQVSSVEVTATHTETEALLLENTLIKRHRPRYNVLLRDDKSFPYVRLTDHDRFPRLAFYRGARREPGRYFGPFANAGAVRNTLGLIQKLFRLRQCDDSFFRNRSRPCLQHQIGRCSAPCVGLIDDAAYAGDVGDAVLFLEGHNALVTEKLVERMQACAADLDYESAALYRDRIGMLRSVDQQQHVAGGSGDIDVVAAAIAESAAKVAVHVVRGGQSYGTRIHHLRQAAGAEGSEVLRAFVSQHYLAPGAQASIPAEVLIGAAMEDAPLLAAALGERAGHRVRLRRRVRGERARWLEMAQHNADLALAQDLASRSGVSQQLAALAGALGLDEPPQRIECFDVSHSSGESTVASCVVFGPEGPEKNRYRRFNVRGASAGDDYGALREALVRRYTRQQREGAILPDLLLIDGGRAQLGIAREVLCELQLDQLPIAGIAKGPTRKPGLEQIWLHDRPRPLLLEPTADALHLVQRVRDEAHRFAVAGHRGRRARSRRTSVLEHIPGVGSRRRQRLLSEFGGLQGVARAGVEDLCRIEGIGPNLAQTIYDALREQA